MNFAPPEWDRLLMASQRNRPDMIRALIQDEGVDPSHANPVGQSALHVASLWGHVDCVKALIELGARVNATNRITGATPLHSAIQTAKCSVEKRLATVTVLLEGGANLSKGDFYGSIPLDYLDEEGREEALREILTPQVPPIFGAIDQSNVEELKKLLKEGRTDVNVRHRDKTPLLKVVEHLLEGDRANDEKQLEMLKLLLEHRSDANSFLTVHRGGHLMAQEDPEDPPLHRICLSLKESYRADDTERIKVLQEAGKLLKDGGAETTAPTVQLLHDAARRGIVPMVTFLIETLGVDPNVKGRQGMTPLQFAARSGKKDIVVHLLSNYKVDTTIKDGRGQTALDAAKVNGKDEIAALLEQQQQQE